MPLHHRCNHRGLPAVTSLPNKKAREAVRRLLTIFDVALVNRSVLERALASRMKDFEDAVLAEAGVLAGAKIIVTRNTRDFSLAPPSCPHAAGIPCAV